MKVFQELRSFIGLETNMLAIECFRSFGLG